MIPAMPLRGKKLGLLKPQPDYAALLEKIFAADSAQVW